MAASPPRNLRFYSRTVRETSALLMPSSRTIPIQMLTVIVPIATQA
jgi:hypothetical protein